MDSQDFYQKDNNVWEFLDTFVDSREELEAFCKSKDLQLLERIGTGGFGSVYLVQNIFTGEKFALKALDVHANFDDIDIRFYSFGKQRFCEIYVTIKNTIQEFLIHERTNIDVSILSRFLCTLLAHEESDTTLPIYQKIHYPELVEYLCKEEKAHELTSLYDDFLPGVAEDWLLDIIDPQKLSELHMAELMKLAPELCTERYWENGKEFIAEKIIFPIKMNISLGELLRQSNTLFVDHGMSLIKEFYIDDSAKNAYWKFPWFYNDIDKISNVVANQLFCLNSIWERYSLKEIEARFPDFFQLQIKRTVPATTALHFFEGKKLQEIKRLLAIKSEIINTNAMQQVCEGFNQVICPPEKIGNNIFIISNYLYEPSAILAPHLSNIIEEKHEGDTERKHCLAFSFLTTFFYNFSKLLLETSWHIEDIKPGNFKANLAGDFLFIDFGGHYPKHLEKSGNFIGSNDYASYSLFQLINNEEKTASFAKQAQSNNDRLFSAVKVIVRMMTSMGADNLRGTDLNKALTYNFQGYHELLFERLLKITLYDKSSPYHYKHFSLVNKDLSFLFHADENPGIEVALRRFLFTLGLHLTGNFIWSILDEEIKNTIDIYYLQEYAKGETWNIEIIDERLKITEFLEQKDFVQRSGISPENNIKLLEFLFPGLKSHYVQQKCKIQQRKQILGKILQLGMVEPDQYFEKTHLKEFINNIKVCLATIAKVAWLDRDFLKKTWDIEKEELDMNKVDELQFIISKCVNTPRINLQALNNILTELVLWQRRCFRHYFTKQKKDKKEINLFHISCFLLERWAKVHTAFIYKQNTFQKAFEAGWIEENNENAISHLKAQVFASSREEQAMAFLFRELELYRHFPTYKTLENENWDELFHHYKNKIEKNSFFPEDLKNKEWEIKDIEVFIYKNFQNYWKDFLHKDEKERFLFLEQLSQLQLSYKWAEMAICEEILFLLGKAVHRIFKEYNTLLRRSLFEFNVDVPSNIASIYKSLDQIENTFHDTLHEEKRFIFDSFWNEFTILCEKISKEEVRIHNVLNLLEKFSKNIKKLYHKIKHHFLFMGLEQNQSPLLYLKEKLSYLFSLYPNHAKLLELKKKLQYIESKLEEKTVGRNYFLYSQIVMILPQIESICMELKPQVRTKFLTTTSRVRKSAQMFQYMEAKPIFTKFSPENIEAYNGDLFINRLARFLSNTKQEIFIFSNSEREAIKKILHLFYEAQGLKISKRSLNNEKERNVYELLKSMTGDFKNDSIILDDLKKIASSNKNKIDSTTVKKRFLKTIPKIIQSPSFKRSILLEFIEYKMELASKTESTGPIRNKILLVQLKREIDEMQEKFENAQKEYPDHLLAAENLHIREGKRDSEKLLHEAKSKWIEILHIFEAYLETGKKVIDTGDKDWNWRNFFEERNIFITKIYPYLADENLRDIYLMIFDLTPLPKSKDIKEFMNKYHYFQITEEQKKTLKDILKAGNFAKAQLYLDDQCCPFSEREVNNKLEALNIKETMKKNFLEKYKLERKLLPATKRIEKETNFLKKLESAKSSNKIEEVLLTKIWFTKIQNSIEPMIAEYFLQKYEALSQEQQDEIYNAIEKFSKSTNIDSAFSWLFHQYVFLPSLESLDSTSWFHKKASEDISTQLATKYPNNTPVKIEYNIAKTIQEKLAFGWQRQEILDYLATLM